MIVPTLGYVPKLLTLNDAIWPMSWYMRDLLSTYVFNYNPNMNLADFDYIIFGGENYNIHAFANLSQTHWVTNIPLRSWWVPDYTQMNLKKYLRYAIFHVPWNEPGQLFMKFARKKS